MAVQKTALFVSFAILLLASSAFSELWGFALPDVFKKDLWRAPSTTCENVEPDDTWLNISLVALLFNIVLAAFAYMLGGIFGPRVNAWTKGFLSKLLVSGIVVTVLFLAAKTMYAQGISQVDTAWQNAIIIRDSIIAQFGVMTTATTLLSLVGNITPYFRPVGIIGFSFSLQPAFRPIFDGLGITLSMLSVAVSEWYVHEFLLCFAKSRMLSLLMPLGLFLRSFGFTSRAGNVLIAVAIGFYFVFPFMVNMTAFSIEKYFAATTTNGEIYSDASGAHSSSHDWCVQHLNNPIFVPCYFPSIGEEVVRMMQARFSMNTDDAIGSAALYASIHFFTNSHPATLLTLTLAMLVISTFKALVFYVSIVSIIMPLFNLFITITIIKEIAASLGTDIDLSALEKLI